MKGPLATLITCLAIVLAALGYGWYERAQGQRQAEARAHADSLLQVSKAESLTIARRDSIATQVAQDSLRALNVEIRTTKHRVPQAQVRADSIAKAVSGDSVVPRDSVQALVGAFQAERAASATVVSQLEAKNAVLEAEVAGKDSTIAQLTAALSQARAGWAATLAPKSQGLLSRGAELVVKGLALYGAVRLLGK